MEKSNCSKCLRENIMDERKIVYSENDVIIKDENENIIKQLSQDVFYENEKVSARVAYNVTGEYFTGYDQYNPLFVTERSTVDFNATYNVNDNVAVFVEGINVTDEDVHLYSRYEEMTFLYQDHGPIYKLGFRVNF